MRHISYPYCESLYTSHSVYATGRYVFRVCIQAFVLDTSRGELTLRILISYIYGAPSKARNANVVYIWTYVWQR